MKLTKRSVFALLVVLSFGVAGKAQTATINWNDVHQQIEGFGASSAFTGSNLTDGQADLLFSTTNGVGLSLLRSDIPTDGTCGETATMLQAVARGARVWSSPWSPPASMKTNGSTGNGGNLLPGSYQAYANYLSNYVRTLKAQYGINLYALSVQNEPDFVATWDSCTWTGQELHDFILNDLSPTFARDGLSTRIMMPEQGGWAFGLATATLNDPATAAGVSIVAGHNYDMGGASAYPLGQGEGKELWETEVSTFGSFDPSINDALFWAQKIHDWMTVAGANAWHYWWLIGENNDNEGLINNGIASKRLYAMGNFSKFVRPGFYRIGATDNPAGGVFVSAYKDPNSGNFAIVAINENGSDVPLKLALNGFTAESVTPWVTSASVDLAQQSTISVGEGAFNALLPASSITTFVASAGNQSLPSRLVAADTLTLNLSEDAYQGGAQFSATIDGVSLTAQSTATVLHDSGQSQAFTYTGNWGNTGPHNIVITFLNDAYGGSARTDRNLYAASISYDGVLNATAQTMFTTGETATFATGSAPTLSSRLGATDTLTVNLSEDAYQGDAHFAATIDGVSLTAQSTVTILHRLGQSQAFTYTGNWGNTGPHNIVITFLNDAYGGSARRDRNLYAASISYDGVLNATSQTMFTTGGTATFTTGYPID